MNIKKPFFNKVHSKYLALKIFSYAFDDLDDCLDVIPYVNRKHRHLLVSQY
jgi:hypothetical protein